MSKAAEIVQSLMSDETLYKEASKKEGEVWGKIFSDQRRNDALKEDQAAARELGINRDKINLRRMVAKHGIEPANGLSLACGGGRAERQLMQHGICETFHGIDIAEGALAEAAAAAEAESLAITYEQSDLNTIELKQNAYDLVVTQNCLHHVLQLERLRDQIFQSLRPGGIMWIHDYIGETQFQYSDDRLAVINTLLEIIPDEMHEDVVNLRSMKKLVRKEPGTLVSPFEAIRSAEIMPVFLEKFDIVEKCESDAFLSFVCPVGTRHHYAQNEDRKLLFDVLFFFDRLLIQKEILPPREGIYMLTPKKA